jgi:hypothetical protein
MMSLKLVWDYAYYWGVLSLLFFKEAMTDVSLMRELTPVLSQAQSLNRVVQQGFRQRAEQRLVLPANGIFMNQYKVPCLKHFNRVLEDDSLTVAQALPINVELLTVLSESVLDMLGDGASTRISDHEREFLGDYRHSVLA